jgi:hypothetical protein
MAQIGRNLETTGHCSHFGFCERRLFASKYDIGFCKPQLVSFEEPSAVELRASLGREIVASLPRLFREKNNGQFVAVTYTGKVLTVCSNLEELNKKIAEMHLHENYYIERLGYATIAQI